MISLLYFHLQVIWSTMTIPHFKRYWTPHYVVSYQNGFCHMKSSSSSHHINLGNSITIKYHHSSSPSPLQWQTKSPYGGVHMESKIGIPPNPSHPNDHSSIKPFFSSHGDDFHGFPRNLPWLSTGNRWCPVRRASVYWIPKVDSAAPDWLNQLSVSDSRDPTPNLGGGRARTPKRWPNNQAKMRISPWETWDTSSQLAI